MGWRMEVGRLLVDGIHRVLCFAAAEERLVVKESNPE
jgi:hypothetical protein